MSHIAEWLGLPRAIERVFDWLGSIAFPFICFVVLRWLLEATARLHWLASVVVTAFAALLVLMLVVGLKRKAYRQFETRVIIGLFLMTALLAIIVFASASALVYAWDPRTYSGAIITVGKLSDFYGYMLLDAMPGVQLWDTFQVPPPLSYHGFLPALLLLAFRLAVVVQLIASLKEWVSGAPSKGQERASPTA
jgi:hypothetical protein